jgi:hypothetical protein
MMTTRCRLLPLSVLLVCWVWLPTLVKADSLLDKAIGGTVDGSIDKAKDALNQIGQQQIGTFLQGVDGISNGLLQKGANEGRLALVQAANEMQVAIGVARTQFGDELSQQIANASAQLRPVLVELQRWKDAESDIEKKAFELEDLVAMDLGRLPFSPDYFGIRRITGTVFLENAAQTYRISISGDNFGTVIVGQKVAVTATFDGAELDPPQSKAPEKVIFDVPASKVKDRFNADKIVTIPLRITVTRIKDHWLLGSLHPTKTVLVHNVQIALLPDLVGELIIETSRPKNDWVADTPAVQNHAISKDTDFTFTTLSGAAPTGPAVGNQRYEEGVQADCSAVTRNAWRLHDGEVILDSDPMFGKEGWTTTFYVGEPESPDWNKADQLARDKFGWTPGFSNNNRCSKGNHCHLDAAEIQAHSEAITTSVDECKRMRMGEKNFSPNHSSAIITIRGNTPHESLWTVTVPISTYKEIGINTDPVQVKPVYASKPVTFDIQTPKLTVTNLHFRPKNDTDKYGVLPGSIPNGPQYVQESNLGSNTTRYEYSFHYNNAVLLGD